MNIVVGVDGCSTISDAFGNHYANLLIKADISDKSLLSNKVSGSIEACTINTFYDQEV